jgi:hypothetical protein
MKLFNLSQVNFFNLLINITLILHILYLNNKICFFKTSAMASFLFVKNIFIFNSKHYFQLPNKNYSSI